ncbi:uncharacterized protein LOC111284466 [Durio zibethinus]|uniref:Uncharacterized protein LOC111284466 n=1 Tax=Durio zibethinus TaxID=66656 RepID=A0A6P5XL37_DURZI|nr:uncharacterized protein LOC111284466 [Durio zibethinus]
MEKRKHLYWTACSAHCLDLCLEDIERKKNVAKVLDDAKKVTCFIYNHIWTVNLMKKYTQGKQILRPALTRFATHFIQLEEIIRQKQSLREMFNSKEFKDSKWGQQKSEPVYEMMMVIGDGDGANFGDNMDANRPYSPFGGEFGLAATDGLFINMTEYGGNPFAESSEGQSARTARSKEKGWRWSQLGSQSEDRESDPPRHFTM